MPTQPSVNLFVDNRAQVTAKLAGQLARNRFVGRLQTVSASELSGMVARILDYFAMWCGGDERQLSRCLDYLEDFCFVSTIPLVEACYALYILRDGITARLAEAAESENSETIQQVNKFFEMLVRDLLRRY